MRWTSLYQYFSFFTSSSLSVFLDRRYSLLSDRNSIIWCCCCWCGSIYKFISINGIWLAQNKNTLEKQCGLISFRKCVYVFVLSKLLDNQRANIPKCNLFSYVLQEEITFTMHGFILHCKETHYCVKYDILSSDSYFELIDLSSIMSSKELRDDNNFDIKSMYELTQLWNRRIYILEPVLFKLTEISLWSSSSEIGWTLWFHNHLHIWSMICGIFTISQQADTQEIDVVLILIAFYSKIFIEIKLYETIFEIFG